MRHTIFTSLWITASLLCAMTCLSSQGFSQVGTNAIPTPPRVGQAVDNARNAVGNSLQQSADQIRSTGNTNTQANVQAQSNVGGQTNNQGQSGASTQPLQNQANAQIQGNVGPNGVNNRAGLNVQDGLSSQGGLNGQAGLNGRAQGNQQNAQGNVQGNSGVQNGQFGDIGQTRGPGAPQQSGIQDLQSPQGWQNNAPLPISPMARSGNTVQDSAMSTSGAQPSGPVYMLRHDSTGREFICVNGNRVYFDQPGMNPNTGAPQDQRRAGYAPQDQPQNAQPSQQQDEQGSKPSLTPLKNEDSIANPGDNVDVKADDASAPSNKPETDALNAEVESAKDATDGK